MMHFREFADKWGVKLHEFPITQSIVKISNEEAEKHGAKKITEIRLKVGELSGLMPECIQVYFDMCSKGTKAEGAVLKIEKIPICFKCNICGTECDAAERKYKCPNCGSKDIKVISGNEFLIDSMEVE